MTRFRRLKGNRDWVVRDAQQAVLAALLIVVVAAGSLSDGKIIPDFFGGAVKTKAVETVPDDELKTGSIYITPSDGSICEHRLIDNATWRIRPNGHVACDEAISGAAQMAARNSAARLEAIRDGFFQKR
jgi:hypothetical protein